MIPASKYSYNITSVYKPWISAIRVLPQNPRPRPCHGCWLYLLNGMILQASSRLKKKTRFLLCHHFPSSDGRWKFLRKRPVSGWRLTAFVACRNGSWNVEEKRVEVLTPWKLCCWTCTKSPQILILKMRVEQLNTYRYVCNSRWWFQCVFVCGFCTLKFGYNWIQFDGNIV